MFSFLQNTFTALYKAISAQFTALFARNTVDQTLIKDLEKIMLEADAGIDVTRMTTDAVSKKMREGVVSTGSDAKIFLATYLKGLLSQHPYTKNNNVIMLVGINGTGKTTTAAKLAWQHKKQGEKVLLVAADTFRAAAVEQLETWAKKIDIPLVKGTADQDPASVAFKGCEEYKKGGYDVLIIDTAGRLQTKTNLMRELEKMHSVINKQLPGAHVSTLLTIDAFLGQNSLDQARVFNEAVKLDGVILTKMDATAKGGIVFAIVSQLQVPIAYCSFGEQIEQLQSFDNNAYVDSLLNS